MKTLLKSIKKSVLAYLKLELKGQAGGSEESVENPIEFLHVAQDPAHGYDQVGGKDDETDPKPPKTFLLLKVHSDGEGFDEGDEPTDIRLAITYTKKGVKDNLDISIENNNYDTLYSQFLKLGAIVKESKPGEGRYFTVRNTLEPGYTSYVDTDSPNEVIRVGHQLVDSFHQLDLSLLVNKSA